MRRAVVQSVVHVLGCQRAARTLGLRWTQARRMVKDAPRHHCCPHRHACLHYVLQGLCRMFGVGYVVQVLVRLLSSLSALRRRPGDVRHLLWGQATLGLPVCLALYSALFRGVNCALRWVRDKDSALHGMAAGFVAGGSMYFYKSVPVALFCASKLVEVLYFRGIEAGHVPYIPHAEFFIYAFSTAFVFHAAVLEPQALRPAYWKWLLRVTHDKFAVMNRHLLDVFGTNSSQMFRDFWPQYDPRYTSLRPPR